MHDKIPFAVLSTEEPARAAIAQGMVASGAIRVVADASRPEDLEPMLQSNARLGIYLDLSSDAEQALDWVETLGDAPPPLLAGGPAEPQVILRAMRAGALGFFPGHQFDGELERITARLQSQAAAEAPAQAGRAVAVLGAKGGVGSTTVACEIAAALARSGGRTAILDAKTSFGDVALHFDVSPTYTLADVAEHADDLDASFLATVAHLHEGSGVHVVAAPSDPEDAEGIGVAQVERAIELLQSEFDWVVVDLPRITDEISLQILDRVDQTVLVTTTEVTSVARAQQHCKILEQLGHGEGKVHIVANRASRPSIIGEEDPFALVGLGADAHIPDDPNAFSASIETGSPVSADGGGKVAGAFSSLVRDLHGWCGVDWQECEEQASLGDRLQDFVRSVKCRLARD
jgi:pilus assembly protein CpaE